MIQLVLITALRSSVLRPICQTLTKEDDGLCRVTRHKEACWKSAPTSLKVCKHIFSALNRLLKTLRAAIKKVPVDNVASNFIETEFKHRSKIGRVSLFDSFNKYSVIAKTS